jgi:hypothetical protein
VADHGAHLLWRGQLGANTNPFCHYSLWEEIPSLPFIYIFLPQGKRVAGEGEAHMSDMYHENTMLQTENDK